MPRPAELLFAAALVVGVCVAVLAVAAALTVLSELATRLIARLLGVSREQIERWETWAEDIPAATAYADWEESVKRPVKKADEYDVVTFWRRIVPWHRGEVAAIKRRLRRRERHVARHRLSKGEQ